MKIKFLIPLICLSSTLSFSQEEDKIEKKTKTTFTGSVDVYYAKNFSDDHI